jgi:hypothetical protein
LVDLHQGNKAAKFLKKRIGTADLLLVGLGRGLGKLVKVRD